MTDQELKDLVASLAIESKKTDEQFRKTDEQFRKLAIESKKTDEQFKKTDEQFRKLAIESKKTDEQFKKTDEQFKKTDEQFKKTDARWEKLEKQYGIFGNFMDNDGKVVEEYFFSGLDKTNKLHGEDYDYFSQGENISLSKGNQREFDIIGFNGNKITALEVKKVVHKKDVEKLVERQLPFLMEFMQNSKKYDKHKIYGGIAGFKINKDAEKYAREKGLIILTKHGNQIEELTKDCEIRALY